MIILMAPWGFNENVPCRNMYLNAHFLVGGIVREGLRVVVLGEEVCHWRKALRFQRSTSGPVSHYVSLLPIRI